MKKIQISKRKYEFFSGMEKNKELQEELSRIKYEYRLTQAQIADGVHVKPSYLSDMLNGRADYNETFRKKLLTEFPKKVQTAAEPSRPAKKKIPLYNDSVSVGGLNGVVANVDGQDQVTEWIDAGDWFPGATAAIQHYGDSMVEYPSGCILALKRVNDPRLLINGETYVIETDEFRITKQIQDDGDYLVAYSSNRETYPDGRLIHSPIRIPKETIRHLDLVLGYVVKRFSNGPVRIAK